ncbi:PEP/pyruvate-binding domain-containing protein [Umezawaea sp. Da 62-37]|uniref:PEP/pyruvate-binding domain-containing protein n=1 Tax=Umezawaea sp. Da 62-37 TaxID=3075927 RepID=UPI0028F74002|nr:PEP/pyruvate-binding domain-containing protein [Umezawaea sp. Da 62-37]WNV88510.1 PEP/pyruvate-binding domain-containing protein [Umezawaea sp. Da 62-37]
MSATVLAMADLAADLAAVGGKGESLAKLTAAGLPVPPGFHVTTAAYREFLAANHLTAAVVGASEREVADLFAAAPLPPDVATAVADAYADLGGGAVAVRSSATAEDLPDASFAGQQDTFLDVSGTSEVLDAVKRCWASLWTERAVHYRARHAIAPDDVAIAVVVQRMVPATAAGVLFTADPVTGVRDRLVINAVRGLGEALVSGAADPQVVVLDDHGITERRGDAVLSDDIALELAGLGRRIEKLYGWPVDVEWAVCGDEVSIVQARPITVTAHEEWNSSLDGDYLWTCANLGEAIPSVMTPATWSLVRIFMSEVMSVPVLGGHRMDGNIGGRFYLNLSLTMAAGSALGLEGFVRRASEQAFGRIPSDVDVPRLPLSRGQVLRDVVPTAVRFLRRLRPYQKDLSAQVEGARLRSDDARARIAGITEPAALKRLWHADVDPLLRDTSRMLAAGARLDGAGLVRIRPWLLELVDEADANALLTGLHTTAGPLASLGPVIGLDRLARGDITRGDITRDEFIRDWGHRCPDEFEVSVPRPVEDPAWLDREVEAVRDSRTDVRTLLARQQETRAAAADRFRARHPRKVRTLERRMARAAVAARGREAGRSEVIRAFWVLRAFLVRAGELTGVGDDVFFLSVDEVLALLDGDRTALDRVAARRETHRRYAALPPYPTLVRGHFDPFRWAADPDRRSDVFDETRDAAPLGDAVTGFAGAAGIVEGVVRVLTSVADGTALKTGEILVTTVTNIGWTPLFPRVAAVVTDIGAPLSHAAIVARELGIPAVVGTGNATTRLRTGDRVRVDGGRGTVEVLTPRA